MATTLEKVTIEKLNPETGATQETLETYFAYDKGNHTQRDRRLCYCVIEAISTITPLEVHPVAGTVERINASTKNTLIATFTSQTWG